MFRRFSGEPQFSNRDPCEVANKRGLRDSGGGEAIRYLLSESQVDPLVLDLHTDAILGSTRNNCLIERHHLSEEFLLGYLYCLLYDSINDGFISVDLLVGLGLLVNFDLIIYAMPLSNIFLNSPDVRG